MAKDLISEFVGAISTDTPEPNTTYNAIVSRVDADGTVWVSVEGSNNETPTSSVSSEAKKGDAVKVEWRNNRLYLAGNYTDPAAGVETVKAVEAKAGQAMDLADSAKADVKSVNQYFWHVKNGAERGAHITEVPKAVFTADPENGGGNLLATSNGIAVRDGLTEMATFNSSGATIYEQGDPLVKMYRNNDGYGALAIGATEYASGQMDVNVEGYTGANYSLGQLVTLRSNGTEQHFAQFLGYGQDGQGSTALITAQGHNKTKAEIELDSKSANSNIKLDASTTSITGKLRASVETAMPTITRTSGGTVSNIVYKRTGNVAMLSFSVAYNTSVASGANVFEGTIPDGYRPVTHARGCGYYGAHSIIGQIGTDGAITIRNASSTAVTLSSNVGLTFTYIIE